MSGVWACSFSGNGYTWGFSCQPGLPPPGIGDSVLYIAAIFLSPWMDYDSSAVGEDLSLVKMAKSGFHCARCFFWLELDHYSGFLALAFLSLINNNIHGTDNRS